MIERDATLSRVIDGSTIEMNVEIDGSEIVPKRIRIEGVQMQNIRKQYLTGFPGASGVFAKLKVDEWFYNRTDNFTVQEEIIDICGRILGDIINKDTSESLKEYLLNNFYKNVNWDKVPQQELKDNWFDGEVVTIPGGDQLPIFHIWGKPVFIGYRNNLINRSL